MIEVIKRDKNIEEFSEAKLAEAIKAAADEAGISAEKSKKAIEDVISVVKNSIKGKSSVSSSDLRKAALKRLEKTEPLISRAWRNYDLTKHSVRI